MITAGQSRFAVRLCTFLAASCVAGWCEFGFADETSGSAPTASGQPATRAELSFEELAKQVRPSLVLVRCQDRTGVEFGQGAGFVVGANGLIATARHTIGDGREITVEFPDGTVKPVVEVHASTNSADICVIRVEATGLSPLAVSRDDEPAQGREVAALGHPRGDRNVMATGMVSGHQEIDGVRAVRLAMPIQPGNSGGPVVDRSGEVVGIVTLKSIVEDNVGYAVPANFSATCWIIQIPFPSNAGEQSGHSILDNGRRSSVPVGSNAQGRLLLMVSRQHLAAVRCVSVRPNFRRVRSICRR